MKISVEHPLGSEFPREYPKMRINRATGLIVLFTAETRGDVMFPGTTDYRVHFFRKDWNPAEFVDFEGKVTFDGSRDSS